jgi:TatD DNase family protein
MLIDTHTHVNFKDFKQETQGVIQRALDAGVWMINAGTQIDTSRSAVALAQQYPEGVYAAVALHPEHTYEHMVDEEGHVFKTRQEIFDYEAYKKIAADPNVVAIGECGLDYYYFQPGDDIVKIKAAQRAAFDPQIELAHELDKALMIHCRPTKNTMDAYEDIADVMANVRQKYPDYRFELHCYTGNLELAQRFVELGGYISCSGIITFDKTGRSEEVVRGIPLDRLLIETDAPYLAPAVYRGQRNEPVYVEHVARKFAEFKNISYDEVAAATTQNARTLFKI